MNSSDPTFDAAVAAAVARAREVWPGVELPTETFVRFVRPHLDTAGELAALRTSDLYLAAACHAGDPKALAVFDEQILSAPNPTLIRMRLPTDVVEEARQVLRLRFFVGDGETAPKILDYSGAGSLHGWVRAALVRAALRLVRPTPVDADPDTLGAIAAPESDLELDYLKRHYGAHAEQCIREGFAELEPRERNILRQFFGLGLGVDDIASFYRVHRVTAWRWVTAAREALAEKTRDRLAARLALAHDEISSMLRLIQSQLEEGLRRLLA